MPITTSYFANRRKPEGTRIAVVRYPFNMGKEEYEWRPEFAPSKLLLDRYKSGEVNWGEYRRRYIEAQRRHYKRKPDDFTGLLERAKTEMLILCCYEKYVGPETECHRLILVDLLKKMAKRTGQDVEFIDETMPGQMQLKLEKKTRE